MILAGRKFLKASLVQSVLLSIFLAPCLLPLGGPPLLHPGFCLFEYPSAQLAYKSSLPADVVMAEVTADGALLLGFLTLSPHPPRHGVRHGTGTFTCHHASGRSGTRISGAAVCHCSRAPLCLPVPLLHLTLPPNLCVSDTETLIRPEGGGSQHTLLSGKATIYLECKEIHFPRGETLPAELQS